MITAACHLLVGTSVCVCVRVCFVAAFVPSYQNIMANPLIPWVCLCAHLVKGSLDAKVPSYEVLKMP